VATPHIPHGPRVLIVDDDPDLLELLQRILQGAGYVTRGATTAAAAMSALDEDPGPAALIVDVSLAGRAQLAERLRANQASLPVLFISGYAIEDVWTMGIPTPGPGLAYLKKPFGSRDLLESLANVLDRGDADGRHAGA
jgi:DNA-binding response OmpR family regulator